METLFLKDIPNLQDTVVTVGAFDGIHLGHQILLKMVVADARSIQAQSVLLTFQNHPRQAVQTEEINLITTPEQRAEILSELKIDYTILIDDEKIFQYSPERFIDLILVKRLKVREVVVGFNFRFGKERSGDVELLKRRGLLLGFKVKVIGPVRMGGEIISSSRIRDLLSQGKIEEATSYLGRHYEIRGTVIKGEGRGRGFGFPTANIQPDIQPLIGNGVYTGLVSSQGKKGRLVSPRKVLVSYGTNPTVGELSSPRLEILIPDFEGELYGQRVFLQIVRHIRPQKKFQTVEELTKAIKEDLRYLE